MFWIDVNRRPLDGDRLWIRGFVLRQQTAIECHEGSDDLRVTC